LGSIGKITPFLKEYWVQIVVALAAMLVMSITDLLVPRQVQTIIDEGIANNDTSVILRSSLLMIGLTLMSLVLAFVNTNLSVGVSEKFAADWRLATFRRIQLFSFDNLDKLQTGELLVRLTSDISIVKSSVMMTMRIAFRAPLLLIGSIAMLVVTSPRLALLLVVLLPILGVLIWIFSAKARPMFKTVQEKLDKVNTVLHENIAGVRLVKAFVRSDYEEGRICQA